MIVNESPSTSNMRQDALLALLANDQKRILAELWDSRMLLVAMDEQLADTFNPNNRLLHCCVRYILTEMAKTAPAGELTLHPKPEPPNPWHYVL